MPAACPRCSFRLRRRVSACCADAEPPHPRIHQGHDVHLPSRCHHHHHTHLQHHHTVCCAWQPAPFAAEHFLAFYFTILFRYNLLEEKICGKLLQNILCLLGGCARSRDCRTRRRQPIRSDSAVGCVPLRVRQLSRQISTSCMRLIGLKPPRYSGNTIQIFMTWTTLVVQIMLNFLVSFTLSARRGTSHAAVCWRSPRDQ